MAFVRRRAVELTCAALLAAFAAVLLVQAATKTITTDEVVIIPAGYAHLQGNFEPVNDHPPLLKLWAALPLPLFGIEAPPSPPDDASPVGLRTHLRAEGFWRANVEQLWRVTVLARGMVILLSVATGALIFALGRRLFGPTAGLLAVTLFVLEPTVLAHGRIVQTDMAATLCWLGFTVAAVGYVAAPTRRRAAIVGAVTGAGLVTKFSLLVLVPGLVVVLAVVAVRRRWRRTALLHAGIAALAVLLVVNLAYGFDRRPIERWDVEQARLAAPSRADDDLDLIGDLDVLVPTDFLLGMHTQWHHRETGHNAFALGRHGDHGWWWYFPAAFALKTTVPFLVLAAGSLALGAWLAVRRRERRWLAILLPFGVYLAGSTVAGLNIGVRHFLPAYPLLFLAAGAGLARALRWAADPGRAAAAGRGARVAVGVVLAWCAVEAAATYPDYIPYMNQLACCAPNYEYLSDSNVEWGDAVGDLADYLRARGQDKVQAAILGGFATLGLHGVAYIDALSYPQPPEPTEYIAIGASFLNGSVTPGGPPGSGRATEEGRVNFFAEYRDREPEAVIGDEIYVYRLTSTTR